MHEGVAEKRAEAASGVAKWRSLRARTGASFTLLVALLLLGLSGVLTARASLLEESRAQAALQAARARLEVAWSAPLPANAEQCVAVGLRLLHTVRASAEVREAAEDAQSLALLLVGADGRELYRSPGHAPQWPVVSSPDWETVQVPRYGELAVLALPRFRARLALQRQRDSLLLLSGMALACAALGSWVLVGRTLSPIGRLSRQARTAARSGASGLQTRLVAPSPDREMTELVETFNALLQRLSEDAAARGRFYAAASHELRTPLQALGGHLDLALSRERDAAAYRAALEEARGQSRRLAGLVSELLRLNQLEMATSKPAAEPLELPDLLESVLSSLHPAIEARGLRLEADWQEDIAGGWEIMAPRAHAEMLVRNLLDNAVKYTQDGGLLSVCLEHSTGGGSVRLEVWNECAPREDWQVEKWCEPFFRPDASRRSQTGGSGLGLALVKALCEANGWEMSVRAEADGVRATVLFAAAEGSGGAAST